MENKKRKKLIILIVIAVILIISGIFVACRNNNKAIIIRAIDNINSTLKEKYMISNDNNFKYLDYTVQSNIKLDFNNNQSTTFINDYGNYLKLFDNLSKTENNLVFKQDRTNKKLLLSFNSKFNDQELIDYRYLIENNTEYYYIKDFLNSYINNGNNSYYESLTQDITNEDNVNYIYKFIIHSFIDNINNKEISKKGEKTTINDKVKILQKISIEFDNNNLKEIFKKVLKDLKNDDRANKILTGINTNFNKTKISDKVKYLDDNQKIILSVYVDNITYKIRKYNLDFIDKNNTKTISYEEQGVLNIYKNNTLTTKCSISYNPNKTIIDVTDISKNSSSLGQIIIEKKDKFYQIKLQLKIKDMDFNFDLNRIISNVEKNKSYNSKWSLEGVITSNNVDIINIKLNIDSKVSNAVTIDENTDNAIFAKNIDSTKQQELKQKITNLITTLMS